MGSPARPTFDVFLQSTMTSIEQIGRAAGAWTPTLLVESADDDFHMLPIGEHATASAADLGWVSAALANLQAVRVARIGEARVLGEGSDVMVLHVVEPGRAETWVAKVKRDGQTARLGEWKQQAFGGLVGQCLTLAVEAVASRN